VPSVVSVTVAEYHDFDDHRAVVRTELATGARVDRFEIVRLLGAGGMGAVYEARDPELGRSVALKVIREPNPQLSLRLLREAQALAQLQHPNVVAVHDVGTDGDEVFVAMELVDGTSLDRRAPKPASWREVVELFVQAGRGLIAAHAKGLIHRDVKPANLFVDRDGRVRVGDFGLARRAADDAPARISSEFEVSGIDETVDASDPATAQTIDTGGGSGDGLLGSPLTHEGSLVGTPKYMAPEQAAGKRASALSDQYSFCVALKEMLPPGSPSWLTRAVERGLERDPAKRHPSMQALVDILAQTPGKRRRTALVIAAIVAIAGVAVALLLVGRRDPDNDEVAAMVADCTAGEDRIADVWNPARRAEVEAAFVATGKIYAKDIFEKVAAALDARRDEWVAMHSQACQATRLFRTQSPEVYERRMACLEDRRSELDAFVGELATIEPKAVDDAGAIVDDIARVRPCADIERLAELERPPTEPTERVRYDELAQQLAALGAKTWTGEWDALSRDGATIAAEAETRGWSRHAARARFLEGQGHGYAGRAPEARTALEAAARAAAAAGDDRLAMQAWTVLIPMLVESGEIEAARTLYLAADAAVQRAGNPPEFRVSLLQADGWIKAMSGDMQGARDVMTAALELAEQDPDDKDNLLHVLGNLSSIELQLADYTKAIEHRRRGLDLSIEHHGKLHPATAEALADLGQALGSSGDIAAGKSTLLEALETMEKVYGPDSPKIAFVLQSLANTSVDDLAAAEAYYVRAVAIHEKAKTQGLGRAMIGLAQTRIERNDMAGAREVLDRVFPIIEARSGTENMEYAVAESAYGMAVGCKAKDRLDHAVKVLTADLGAEHPMTAEAIATRKACK
jgi:eukaryotic-like serine/threonine-protein kinase